MAMTERQPGGPLATVVGLLGLFAVGLGERVFVEDAFRGGLTGVGAVLVLGSLGWRLLQRQRATGDRRSVQSLLLLAHGGVALALALYAASTDAAIEALGLEFSEARSRSHYTVGLSALWPVVLTCAALPLTLVELAWAPMRHARLVELRRIRSAAASGLTVALALCFLVVAGFVAHARDVKIDLSYFRTSQPGEATLKVAQSFEQPLRALLFFPDVNEVGDEVLGYLRALDEGAGGDRVHVERHDRLLEPRLARTYKVDRDGTVVLGRGERQARRTLGAQLGKVRPRLRKLDGDIHQRLLELRREKHTVYLTAGHGELNDPSIAPGETARPRGQGSKVLEALLGQQHLQVRKLTLAEGLGNKVPDDAAAVLVLGPRQPLIEEALRTLAAYAREGGHLLVALEPDGEADLGPLGATLGLSFDRTLRAVDEAVVRSRFNDSDRTLLVTRRYASSHPAVTTLSQYSDQLQVLFAGAGSLARTKHPDEVSGLSAHFVVRGPVGTFADANGNFRRDEGEPKQNTNLAVAISAPVVGEQARSEALRAVVLADADALSDSALRRWRPNRVMANDLVRWLVGEESLAGRISTEEDHPVSHTREEDEVWFYATIFAVPALVLGCGLGFNRRRRRGRRG